MDAVVSFNEDLARLVGFRSDKGSSTIVDFLSNSSYFFALYAQYLMT